MKNITHPAGQNGTSALRSWLRAQFLSSAATNTDLDLKIYLAPNVNFHVRVLAVDELLSGYRLGGFDRDTPRTRLGEIAIPISAIILAERIG